VIIQQQRCSWRVAGEDVAGHEKFGANAYAEVVTLCFVGCELGSAWTSWNLLLCGDCSLLLLPAAKPGLGWNQLAE